MRAMFTLLPDETIEAGVNRVLSEKVAQTAQRLASPVEPVDLIIHESRKNLKRMRAVLRLVAYQPGPHFQAADELLRYAGRLLAPLRTSVVLVETVLKLENGNDGRPLKFPGIHAELADQHQRGLASFHGDGVTLGVATGLLGRASELLSEIRLPADDLQALAGGLGRTYRKCQQKLIAAAGSEGDPVAFHAWRKQVKYAWHQLEMIQLVEPLLLDARIDAWRVLAGVLGDAHDLAELEASVADLSAAPASERKAVRREASRARRLLETEALRLGAPLLAARPKQYVGELAGLWKDWRRRGLHKSGG